MMSQINQAYRNTGNAKVRNESSCIVMHCTSYMTYIQDDYASPTVDSDFNY